MTKFFANCSNLDELKKAYRDAAKANHPDMGGDTATMQRINAAYTARFEILKNRQNETAAADPDGSTKATTEAPADFINIIAALLKLDGLDVELCGRWLWIGGNTMTHKEALKAAGCRWSQSKKLWSWHFAEDGARWHKSHYSMDDIRTRYGSETFSRGAGSATLTA